MKKCLIIEPHSDDSCISSGGFLKKYENEYEYFFRMYISSDMILRHANKIVASKERVEEYKNYATSFKSSHYIDGPIFDCEAKSDTVPLYKFVSAIEHDLELVKPDLLIIQGDSYHQDHHNIYKASLAALRPCGGFYPEQVWIAENSTYVHKDPTNNELTPNIFIELTEDLINYKLKLFREKFSSQIRPKHNYLSGEGLKEWARYRGIEARCDYAEGFYLYYRRM